MLRVFQREIVRGAASAAQVAVMLAVLTPFAAGAGAQDDYRLTGIMGADRGTSFAVIETTADGRQQLLQEGSSLGSGYVKRVSPETRSVVLAFPDGEYVLRLKGSAAPEEYREEYLLTDFVNDAAQQRLDGSTLSDLEKLAASAATRNDEQLSEQLNSLLGLAPSAQIAAFNDEGVASTRELVAKLGDRIAGLHGQDGFLGTIAVDDTEGRRRVYLSVQNSAVQQQSTAN